MPLSKVALILATGIIAGFMNTIGGGGSLLTLPMFIFLGMPSALANGTNRIALVVQNISAVLNFKRKGFFDLKAGLTLGIPAVFGSILGAFIAINIPDQIFNKILAVVMLIVLFLIVKKPAVAAPSETNENIKESRKIPSIITFFFIGIYGGFIQAGIGFIIIAALSVLTGMSLVRINSLKVFVILLYMITSLSVFLYNGQVDWLLGSTLAVGNGIGAWLGSSLAVSKGDKWIRLFLIVIVSIMAAKLFGLFSLFKF